MAGARRVELFLEAGGFVRTNSSLAEEATERRAGDWLELVWAGRLEARKALPLALEVMAQVNGMCLFVCESPARDRSGRAYERPGRGYGLERTACIFWVRCPGSASSPNCL